MCAQTLIYPPCGGGEQSRIARTPEIGPITARQSDHVCLIRLLITITKKSDQSQSSTQIFSDYSRITDHVCGGAPDIFRSLRSDHITFRSFSDYSRITNHASGGATNHRGAHRYFQITRGLLITLVAARQIFSDYARITNHTTQITCKSDQSQSIK